MKIPDKMGVNEFRQLMAKQNARNNQQTGAKYGNRYVEVDGILFQSNKEAQYYGKLKLRVKAGDLERFELQKIFPIKINGIEITTYRCDFIEYYKDGRVVIIDVKSEATRKIPLYIIKKNLMLAVLGITIVEK